MVHGRSIIALALAWASAFSLVSAPDAWSVGETGSFAASPVFNTVPPPAFQAAQMQQFSNIFTSCMNFTVPVQNMIGAVGQTIMSSQAGPGASMSPLGPALQMGQLGGAPSCPFAAGVGVGTVCPNADAPPDISGMSCPMLMMGNGQAMLAQAEQQLSQALCSIQCKKAKAEAVQGELNCLMTQANSMVQQIGALTQTYQQNIQKMQGDVMIIKTAQADRQSQLADVNLKLSGDKGSGLPGLLTLKQQMVQLMAAMPQEVDVVRGKVDQYERSKRSLEQQVLSRKANLTSECVYTRTVDTYRCTPNGPPVSAVDYLKCRFEQSSRLGRNNVIERDATQTKQARAKSQALASLLDQMRGDTAASGAMPTNAEEQRKFGDQPNLILSVNDVERRYGNQLRNYKIGNATALDFLMKVYKGCDTRADATVNREEKNPNSTIGTNKFALTQAEADVKQMAVSQMNKYSLVYSNVMAGLTGQAVPLNLNACRTATMKVQLNCLKDIQSNMQGLMDGSTQAAKMNVQIKGNNPATFINFSCAGLNGCVSSMQSLSLDLVAENKKLENFKEQYVLQANQSVEAYTKQVASQLSYQSQMLTDKMKMINLALASLGAGGINIPQVRGEGFQFDADKLVKAPTNLVNLIGQYVSPPLLDLSGNGLGNSLGGMANVQTNLANNLGRIYQAYMNVSNKLPSCRAEQAQRIFDNLTQKADALGDTSCAQFEEKCNDPATQQQLLRTMNDAAARLGASPYASIYSLDSLQTGITSYCAGTTGTNTGQNANMPYMMTYSPGRCFAFRASLMAAEEQLKRVSGTRPRGSSSFGAFSAP